MMRLLNYGRIRPPIISSPARNKKRAHPSSAKEAKKFTRAGLFTYATTTAPCNAMQCNLYPKPKAVGWRPAGARRARSRAAATLRGKRRACMNPGRERPAGLYVRREGERWAVALHVLAGRVHRSRARAVVCIVAFMHAHDRCLRARGTARSAVAPWTFSSTH